MKWISLAVSGLVLFASPVFGITHDARMSAWRNARFGIFIHWGAYSQTRGWWNGEQVVDGNIFDIYRPHASSEWMMCWKQISKSDYRTKVANRFRPSSFDAASVVAAVKSAGAKYLVVTAKHHEGFSMFNTSQKPDGVGTYEFYNTNYFDPIAQLKSACESQGILFGIYYSIIDWYHSSMRPENGFPGWELVGDTDEARESSKKIYMQYMKDQLAEIIKIYRPRILWFDGDFAPWFQPDDAQEVRAHVLSLAPNLIINDRCKKLGHYVTPEQALSPGWQDYDWESCMTMNDSWGYRSFDRNWKSATTLIHTLVTAASRGGNLLLNIGPDQKGVVPGPSLNRLEIVGAWLTTERGDGRTHGEAIYGTTGVVSGHCPPNVRLTKKPGKLYIHILNGTSADDLGNPTIYLWPEDNKITIGKLRNYKPDKVYMLNDPGTVLPSSVKGNKMTIGLPPSAPDPHCSIVVVECTGTPTFVIPGPTTAIPVTIEAEDYVAMNGVVTEPCGDVGGGYNIGHIYQNDWMDYDVKIPVSGVYSVSYRAASPAGGTGRLDFMVDGATLSSIPMKKTNGWQTYTDNPTLVHLNAGTQRIRLFASGNFFNLNKFTMTYANGISRGIVPGKIEAEQYTSVHGLTVEPCGEGGQNIGSAEMGDWVSYSVNVRNGGTYRGEFRLANNDSRGVSSGSFDIIVDGMVQTNARVDVPFTGDWQNYVTVQSDQFELTKGIHNIKFRVTGSFWNMNWFKLTKVVPNLFSGDATVQAEGYARQSGCKQFASSSKPGEYYMGDIQAGDWLEYNFLVHDTGRYLLQIDYATPNTDAGVVDVVVDGEVRATTGELESTGGWENWNTVETPWFDLSKNGQIIRLYSRANFLNINKIRLVLKSTESSH